MPDDVQSALDALVKSKWADARLTVFAVQTEITGSTIRLTGEVLTAEQQAEAERAVHQAAPELQVVNDIAVLSGPDNQWALVKRGLSNLRRSATFTGTPNGNLPARNPTGGIPPWTSRPLYVVASSASTSASAEAR